MDGWVLQRVGDAAIAAVSAPYIDPAVSDIVIRVAASLRALRSPGVRDIVESYCAVTVHFDPLRVDLPALVDALTGAVERATAGADPSDGPGGDDVVSRGSDANRTKSRLHTIPVCYGEQYGPDLEEMAGQTGLAPDEIVRRHTAETYRVYMLGFLPGFAYLGTVPRELAVGRRPTPRLRVPAGSVGIAGRQTGIYPLAAPGGWQLIGRTPVTVFDPERAETFLFHPGDGVRFEAVSAGVYDELVVRA